MTITVVNLQAILQGFNPSKFVVYASLLMFSILFSLRLDQKIVISYWLVFLPLWIWKCLVILGATIGIIVWCNNPEYRMSESSYIHFKSMLISTSLQLLLLIFELLVCDKLESHRHSWSLAFLPLIFISMLSISVCIWSLKNDRNLELELHASVNVLQFALIALKLDNIINWTWVVVFVPAWIFLSFAMIGIIYAMIFSAFLLRSPNISSGDALHRRASLQLTLSYSLVSMPILLFLAFLTSKLDAAPNTPTPGYFVVCLPLFLTLIILIRWSFGSKNGSLWWFGMRTDFCSFLLTIFPCLKEYGNVSYSVHERDIIDDFANRNRTRQNDGDANDASASKKALTNSEAGDVCQLSKPISPRLLIDMPD